MKYLITISYDGSNYKGYQKQPDEITIQEEIEKVLTKINGNKEVTIHASGRTDAGVHAISQKAHFDLLKETDPDKLRHSLNELLPKDIYIKQIEVVSVDFHARFDVKAKEYIYKINLGEYDPIKQKYVYQYNKKLDLVEMERAMKYLEGTQNFKSFTKTNEDENYNYIRTIIKTNLIRNLKNVNQVTLSFLGTGFLRYQVRNMVGTLIEIGEGKIKSEDLIHILKEENRSCAGVIAPPNGLYLNDVFYR